LQARGIRHFKEIEGGFAAISKTDMPLTATTCSSI